MRAFSIKRSRSRGDLGESMILKRLKRGANEGEEIGGTSSEIVQPLSNVSINLVLEKQNCKLINWMKEEAEPLSNWR
ncbi:hypothetical protein LguiA_003829 [Lonicera macranthoides]